MIRKTITYAAGIAIVAAAYWVLDTLWISGHSLFLSLLAGAAALGGIVALDAVFLGPVPPLAEPPAAGAFDEEAGMHRFYSASSWIPLLTGLVLVAAAGAAALAEKWIAVTFCMGLSAILWRRQVANRKSELFSKWAALALVAILLAAAGMRLYKAGSIPIGMATVDEPRIEFKARYILGGERPSFVVGEGIADGAVPFYLQALGMKIFGASLTGFRMDGILIGILLVAMVFMLGREVAGAEFGLYASAFMGLSMWPLTVSRCQYLLNETHLVFLGCLLFVFLGVKKGGTFLFALGGVCFGLCFSAYKAAQLAAGLLPALFILLYLLKPSSRPALKRGLFPFLAGGALGLAPLLLWVRQNPAYAYSQYFSSLYGAHVVGQNVSAALGFTDRMDLAMSRALPNLGRLLKLFTEKGPVHNWYFLADQPVIGKATLFLFIAGLVICFIRFRRAGIAFLVLWWFAGLLPALAADPSFLLDDRRIMLAMPATMMIAALGLQAVVEMLTRAFQGRRRRLAAFAAFAVFFSYLGVSACREYFVTQNTDLNFLNDNHANIALFCRAVYEENEKHPCYVISTRRNNEDSWIAPNDNPFRMEYTAVDMGIQTYFAQVRPEYYLNHGLVYALQWAPPRGDVPFDLLVALTPFHFYLEPWLLREGGEVVREIPLAQGRQGTSFSDQGMAPHPKLYAKLIRIRNFTDAAAERMKKAALFPFSVEMLEPPQSLPSGKSLYAVNVYSPEVVAGLQRYDHDNGNWRVVKRQPFEVVDPYFWTMCGNLPGQDLPPFRLKGAWTLNIPAEGNYRFGASSTLYLSLKLDGKKIFTFIPDSPKVHDVAPAGVLGEPVFLKAGPHRLEFDQLTLSKIGNYNHVFRLVWQKPGGDKETLPLEVLEAPQTGKH
jgi:hypothetical protein